MSTVSSRIIALAACALVISGCTQEQTTAPAAAADVEVEGVYVPPTEPGEEGGTITFAKTADPELCNVRVAFTSLYDNAAALSDGYYLQIANVWSGDVDPSSSVTAAMPISRRGTFRGMLYPPLNKSSWATATAIYLRYWTGSSNGGMTTVAYLGSGAVTWFGYTFRIVDHCGLPNFALPPS